MSGRRPPDPDPLLTDRGVKSPLADTVGRGSVLAAGVDWLTCTAAEPSRAELLRVIGEQICVGQAAAGNDLRPWLWKGYEGIACGGSATGSRADGTILRLSSDCAANYWRHPVEIAQNVSRIDLAVTVRLPSDAEPARDTWAKAKDATPTGRGRRISAASHIETWTEGETVYLGSRKSARFGRLYNKGLESREEAYRDAWRWEVEYKGDAAKNVAREVAQCGSEGEAVLAYVWDTFSSWGVPPSWGLGAEVPPALVTHSQTDDERRLAWLFTQVRPVVARLLANGRRVEVYGALGLPE